jgi:hypothetical protein
LLRKPGLRLWSQLPVVVEEAPAQEARVAVVEEVVLVAVAVPRLQLRAAAGSKAVWK